MKKLKLLIIYLAFFSLSSCRGGRTPEQQKIHKHNKEVIKKANKEGIKFHR